MKIVTESISISELKEMSNRVFGGLVKAVIDIKKEIMVVDADMHADEEKVLIESGSKQDDLWGINLYPKLTEKNFIEYDSMINVRPRLNNFTRSVENKDLQKQIVDIVNKLVNK
jgi:hypothetical protein